MTPVPPTATCPDCRAVVGVAHTTVTKGLGIPLRYDPTETDAEALAGHRCRRDGPGKRAGCVCGCTSPVHDTGARRLSALEPGVCRGCGHYLYLHFRDHPEPDE